MSTTTTTATTWTIEGFCESQVPADWSLLNESSQLFLQRLNLSSTHPFCEPETAPRPYDLPGVPRQGPLQSQDHLESVWDIVITVLAMGGPSLLAMGELWLRLFAYLIAPLGVAHLLWDQVVCTLVVPVKQLQQKESPRKQTLLSVVCLLTIASSVVLFTDTLYVLEFGPRYGFVLWTLSTLLALQTARRHQLTGVLAGKLCLFILVMYLVYDIETGQLTFGHSDEECRVQEGLYYDQSEALAQRLVDRWPESWRRYDVEHGATSWMPTGDSRTGLPFLINHAPKPTWTRVWVPMQDGEVAALDISFPTTETGHDTSKPLYMLLHGLNGGSMEEYVKDFTWRRNAEGSTVVVFVARGLMDLPVRGWDVFHGARYTDAHDAALVLRAGLVKGQVLAGIGYSMGAVILNNYVARLGKDCALDAAVSISGGLDMRYEKEYHRAQRLWQPILTKEMRNSFVVGKWGERVKSRLTKQEMKEMMRAYHITEIDKTAVVAYNKFRDLDHYYSEMSALGDIPVEDHVLPTATQGRMLNLSIPLCVIHALDDPLITWRSVAANEGLLHPGNLTKLGSGNLFLLLTKRGGHVGWPLGWNPSEYNWKWMNDAATSFVEACVQSRMSP